MKISSIIFALVLISLVFFQAQTAQAQALEEGVITHERALIPEGIALLSLLGLGSLASIPVLGSVIAAVVGLLALVGMSALGMIAIPTTTVGILLAIAIGAIVLALGPIGIALVLAILALTGGGFSVSVFVGLLGGAGGILLLAIFGPIIALMSVLCAPLGAIVGGAGAVAGGFSLFAGGAGAITGITLFGLEGILAFCANFPIFYQIIILCCYPFLTVMNMCLPYIDLLCAPIIELCAGAGLVRVIS